MQARLGVSLRTRIRRSRRGNSTMGVKRFAAQQALTGNRSSVKVSPASIIHMFMLTYSHGMLESAHAHGRVGLWQS